MLNTNIENFVTPFILKRSNLTLVIGVIDGDDRLIRGFGQLSESSINSPDGNTLFEIGSISKVFTSTLLSILVNHQELELTAPINRLMKDYQQLPDDITLLSLATHTSGLPRVPSNLMKSVQQDRQNPYAAYTLKELNEYLQSYDSKQRKTEGTISYSNLGFGLLGHILAQHLGLSYEDAIVRHICEPLGLSDTCVTLTEEQKSRLAISRSGNGKPVKNWDLPTLAGAGALRSTANDLLKFLAENLQPSYPPFAQSIAATHTLRCETFASLAGVPKFLSRVGVFKLIEQLFGEPPVRRELKGIALGWFVTYLPSVNQQVYCHNGGTGGYRSFCGFIKETSTGVVVLSNYGAGLWSRLSQYSVDTIGLQILESMNSNTL
jgi:CubicO group peptidase (beta-lactamase class C family)